MDIKTATRCMNNETGVYYLDKRWQRINAITYRRHIAGEDETAGNRYQLELLGGNTNSVIIAPMEDCEAED